jgi:protein-S-isoprenylcysteine O-methyltransferase
VFKKIVIGLIASLIIFILPVMVLAPHEIGSAKPWALVALGLLASITQPSYNPLDKDASAEDKGTARQLVWTVYLVLLLGIVECLGLRYPQSMVWDRQAIIMLLISLAGLLFRAWAVMELGAYFTWHVKIQDGQSVITTGPYHWVRHPSYTGAWILYVFLLLFIHAWLSAILMGILLFLAFKRRIKHEENVLVNQLGNEYVEYAKKVKKLIPYLY